jgi:hypothetical protein
MITLLLMVAVAANELKTRYYDLSVEDAWNSPLLTHLDAQKYDETIANPWVGF